MHRLGKLHDAYPELAFRPDSGPHQLSIDLLTSQQITDNRAQLGGITLATALDAIEATVPTQQYIRKLRVVRAMLRPVNGGFIVAGELSRPSNTILNNERACTQAALEGLCPENQFHWSRLSSLLLLGRLPKQEDPNYTEAIDSALAAAFAEPIDVSFRALSVLVPSLTQTQPPPESPPQA